MITEKYHVRFNAGGFFPAYSAVHENRFENRCNYKFRGVAASSSVVGIYLRCHSLAGRGRSYRVCTIARVRSDEIVLRWVEYGTYRPAYVNCIVISASSVRSRDFESIQLLKMLTKLLTCYDAFQFLTFRYIIFSQDDHIFF